MPAAPVPRAPAPKTHPGTPRHYKFAAAAILVLLTLAAFSNSFSTGFALDNQTLILDDPRIQTASPANLDLIFRHTYWWPNGESGLYRPLTTLSYLLNYAILGNGNHPGGYHWINFFLHAVNALLVLALVNRLMTPGRDYVLWTAFLAALLWAVHPLATEAVTNIIGRADLLAAFGVFSGFLSYLASMETRGWRRGACLAGLACATAFGVFSKESAVVLPAVIVLYELSFERRWRRMSPGLLATLVPAGIMLWQRAVVLSGTMPAEYPFTDNPVAGAGFWIGRLTAVKILGRYLWLVFWPLKLSADYSYAQIGLARGSLEDWMGWLTVAIAAALAAILWRRCRLAFFFLAFAFLNLLPASNLLFPIGAIMAERLLYLSLAGLLAAAVIAIGPVIGHYRLSTVPVAVCAFAIAAGFSLRTWMRNRDWTDDKTMATAGIAASPRSFKFHRLLAAELIRDDPAHRNLDRAVSEADRSVSILTPLPDRLDTPGPWNLAAVCHRMKGDTLSGIEARAQYEQAARMASRAIAIDAASREDYDRRHGLHSAVPAASANVYRTLAAALLRLDRPAQALEAATKAQTIDPSDSGVYREIADADLEQKRGEEAAIALAEGMLATGDRQLFGQLLDLYRSGVDRNGCAIKAGPHGPTLNPACEIVVRDLCEAASRIHRPDLRRRFTCPD